MIRKYRNKTLSTGKQFIDIIEEEKNSNWGTSYEYGQEIKTNNVIIRLIDRINYEDWCKENNNMLDMYGDPFFMFGNKNVGYLAQKKYKNGWSKPFPFSVKMSLHFSGQLVGIAKTYKEHKRKEALKRVLKKK